jgi:hypothetical protein
MYSMPLAVPTSKIETDQLALVLGGIGICQHPKSLEGYPAGQQGS